MRSPLRHLKKTGTEFITEGVDDPAANQQLAEARPYTAKALQQIYRPGYLIDPRHSKVMGSWDIIMLVALMFTAIVTPYEVTFIEEGPCVTILFMVNRFIDLLFLMDICIIFNLAYQEPSGVWVYSRKAITMRYATGFFIIDFMSILPFYATSFVLAEGPVICSPITGRIVNASAPVSESLAGKASSTVKIIKLLRMLKLARVLKASGVLKRIVEDVLMSKFELTYAMLTVLKMICGVILLAHLQACLWALVPYFMSDELIPADGRPQTWVHRFRMDQEERGGTSTGVDVYVASLYWSIMTLTSIGYGDIVPISTPERVLCCAYMIISSLTWTYVIGTAAGIAATLDPNGTIYKTTLDQLNYFMRERRLPKDMRFTLREYFASARMVHQVSGDRELLQKMSPLLQGTVAVRANKLWLDQIWFLKGMGIQREEREFIAELSKRLELTAYVGSERMPIGQLYILRKGMVVRLWRFLGANSVWGEDMLLENLDLVCHAQAVALVYCEVFTLTKTGFKAVSEHFPGPMATVGKRMRKVTLQRSLLRYLIEHMEGGRVRSFIGRRAAAGFTTLPNSLTLDQKMDRVLATTTSARGAPWHANPDFFNATTLPFGKSRAEARRATSGELYIGLPDKPGAKLVDAAARPPSPSDVLTDVPPPPPPAPPALSQSILPASLPPAAGQQGPGGGASAAVLVQHVALLQRQLLASHSALESRMSAMDDKVSTMQAAILEKLQALSDANLASSLPATQAQDPSNRRPTIDKDKSMLLA